MNATWSESTTLADVLRRLGDVPASRVRWQPMPGTAREADVLALEAAPQPRLCELVHATLVEKPMGFRESLLAGCLHALLLAFVQPRRLGVVTPADGMIRLASGHVRIPDVAYFSWDRFPERRLPTEPIPSVVPDLAIEVLSASNTPAEMLAKRHDYFASGCRLVWEFDPQVRTLTVYTAAESGTVFTAETTVSGEPVLPGFTLALADVFAELDQHG